jgi:hypothetical protein
VPILFQATRAEFSRATVAIQGQIRLMPYMQFGLGLLVLICAIVGLVKPNVFGTLITGGSLATLFELFQKNHALSRDQLMLSFLPAKYVLALQLCASKEQYQAILDVFSKIHATFEAGDRAGDGRDTYPQSLKPAPSQVGPERSEYLFRSLPESNRPLQLW